MKNLIAALAVTLFSVSAQAGLGDLFTKKMDVECVSQGGLLTECPISGTIVSVKIKKELSNGKCDKKETWNWNLLQSMIWVDKGCKAIFRVRGVNLSFGNPVYGGSGNMQCEYLFRNTHSAEKKPFYASDISETVAKKKAAQKCQTYKESIKGYWQGFLKCDFIDCKPE